MGSISGPAMLFSVVALLGSSLAYMEALAAHADVNLSGFEPQVAFLCNKPAMHRVVNGWEADYDTDCIEDPADILQYCKKVYPDHDVKNVVEVSYEVNIPDWPRFKNQEFDTTGNHSVIPYRCLVGDFESEALLVPQHCIFDHEHDSTKCERPSVWKATAGKECEAQGMKLDTTGMLVLCGINEYRGVEYVCCPKDEESSEVDDYVAYLQGYDMEKYGNEHAKFKASEKAMQKRQHEKVTKMMKQWQEAREQVAAMRKTDKEGADKLNTDITERFQRLYHAFEDEAASEKKQLIALHQQRVQAIFNKKKRVLMASYKKELESDSPVASKVLTYLKQYIRVEEKDRRHTVNMYEHRRDTDPADALRVRESLIRHLHLIEERIKDAIDMLDRVPELEKKIRPEVEKFRSEKFRSLEISEEDVMAAPVEPTQETKTEDTYKILSISDDDNDATHDYTNIKIDSEVVDVVQGNSPNVAHARNDAASVQRNTFKVGSTSASSSANFVGIAIGSVAVLIVIVVAVVMVKRHKGRQPITHGFVEVDPAASPEERHVANMQMNGYENPTYRYFELGTN